MPDAVVVGAGPNGLVAANLLVDAGWTVEVLEAQPEPGGAVRSDRGVHPDYVSDLFSAFYPLAAASPVLAGLDLRAEGLSWSRAPRVLAHPLPDGRCALLERGAEETAEGLDMFAAGDGAAWLDLYGTWNRLGPDLLRALFTPFPPVRSGVRLAAGLRAAAWSAPGADAVAARPSPGGGTVSRRGRQAPARGQRAARGPRARSGGQRGLRVADVHARTDLRISGAGRRSRCAHRRSGAAPGAARRRGPLREACRRDRRTRRTSRRRTHSGG